jgi:hypothetical protein
MRRDSQAGGQTACTWGSSREQSSASCEAFSSTPQCPASPPGPSSAAGSTARAAWSIVGQAWLLGQLPGQHGPLWAKLGCWVNCKGSMVHCGPSLPAGSPRLQEH